MAHKYGIYYGAPSVEWAKEVIQSLIDEGLAVGPGIAFRRGRIIALADNLSPQFREAFSRAHRRISRRETVWKRSQREQETPSRWTDADWLKCKLVWKSKCAYCGRRARRLTRDHFIPLTDPNCTGMVPWNIVPACVSCNSSKSNRDPHDWFKSHRTRIITNSPRSPFVEARLICKRHKREACETCREKWHVIVDVNWTPDEWRAAYESLFVTVRSIVMGELWRTRVLSSPDAEARIGFSRKRLALILAYLDGLK